MNTKLTLSLDKNIIEKAKSYAESNKTSLSNLIQNYLEHLTNHAEKVSKITPLVESLSGIITLKNEDFKNDYTDYLIEKYK
jgi:deoxyxylulose-5-phosphate synthase